MFKKDLLTVLATAKEQWLLNSASNALAQLDRVEHLRALVSRMDDPSVNQKMFSDFIPSMFKVQNWGSRTMYMNEAKEDPVAEGKRMKTLWLKFIDENQEFLRRGGLIKPGDPRITADYLPQNMCLGEVNGKDWPPLKASKSKQ